MSAETLESLISAGNEALARNDYLLAARIFSQAGAIAPGEYAVLRGVGIAKAWLNAYSEDAYLILEAAAEVNGGLLDAMALRAYALSLAISGQKERAVVAMRMLTDVHPCYDHCYWWAEQTFFSGDLKAAWAAGRELLTLPESWSPEADGPDVPAVLCPPNILTTTIGELSFRLEVIVKARAMGWPMPKRLVLRLMGKPMNEVFLDYWRGHFDVEPATAPVPVHRKAFSTLFLWTPEGTVVDKQYAYAQFSKQRPPPVLTLRAEHREEGEKALRGLGVPEGGWPEGGWYVCLHMRSPAFNDQGHKNHNALRNVDMETYLPAIRRVVEAGGWVFRMGDAGMMPLPEMEQVVDYAHSPAKSALMDVFLCATCRFFISSQSGLQSVAKNFGRPQVLTNQLPYVMLDLDDEDLWIPRILYSEQAGRPLNFRESFAPPYVNNEVTTAFQRLACRPLANTAEQIEAVVVEMLDRCAGRLTYSDMDERLQERFRRACNYHGFGATGRAGRQFLRDHMHYL